MAADMEVAGDFVDEDEAAKFAALAVTQTLHRFIEYLLSLSLPSLRLQEMLFSNIFRINFGVSAIFNVLDHTDFISVFV